MMDRHKCDKMKGHCTYYKNEGKWYYWTEGGAACEVTKCPICKLPLYKPVDDSDPEHTVIYDVV